MGISEFNRRKIIEKWKERDLDKRTRNHVFEFYPGVLEYLTGAPTSDPYQYLPTILRDHFIE